MKKLAGKKQEKTNFLGKNSNAISSHKIGRKGLLKLLFYMFSRRTRIGPSGTPKKSALAIGAPARRNTLSGKTEIKFSVVAPAKVNSFSRRK